MYAALGAHLVTVFFQYVVFPLNRAVRIRGTFLNLVLVLIFGGATVWLYLFLADQNCESQQTARASCVVVLSRVFPSRLLSSLTGAETR